jgi:L-asparaginase / beta-aspartyl-peptidase
MKIIFYTLLFFLVGCQSPIPPDYAIVIHGGAGTIRKENMSDELEKEYLDALHQALNIGEEILENGGTSLEAVEKTIRFLEDSPLFNAGKGAVFTNEGKNELDASIMDGSDLSAGAIAGVTTVKNPISLAKAVMENSEHVLLIGQGAEKFAEINELEIVDPAYFFTQNRFDGLQRALEKERKDDKYGTVGCVALDRYGNIVAGTSTGGMTNKKFNRVGDVPIIGAGTYANNKTCGISCTGHGEFFIRYTVAHDVSALMEYQHLSLSAAAKKVVQEKLVKAGGSGGLVGLDSKGNITMEFNSEGMYRGYAKPNERFVGIYANQP